MLWTAIALAAGVGLTGCESSRYEPSNVLPGGQPAIMPVQPPLAELETITRAAAQASAPIDGEGWRDLFDGRSLTGWQVTDFKQGGGVEVRDGLLVFFKGDNFVGVNCTNEIPKSNYEITLEAMRVAGDDFFCGLTFPVNDSFCSLIVGGWGGGVVGLSNLDGADASENETTKFITLREGAVVSHPAAGDGATNRGLDRAEESGGRKHRRAENRAAVWGHRTVQAVWPRIVEHELGVSRHQTARGDGPISSRAAATSRPICSRKASSEENFISARSRVAKVTSIS